MMTEIYLAVRIYATVHLLYELWIFLFCRKMYGLWDRLDRLARIIRLKIWHWRKKRAGKKCNNKKKRHPREGRPTVTSVADCEVIGKTKSVYIPDPKKAREPVRSEPLPESDFIGEDDDISADEVDDNLDDYEETAPALTHQEIRELMEPVYSEADPDFPTGIPIDRIRDAADILLSGIGDVEKRMFAAETLFQLKDTDLFDLFAENITSREEMDTIIAECLTETGERRDLTESPAVNWDEYM